MREHLPTTTTRTCWLAAVVLTVALAKAQADDGVRVTQLQVGTAGDDPAAVTVLGERIVFTADDGAGTTRMFVSDGTPAGTVPLGPTGTAGSLCSHAGEVWFSLDDGNSGQELWRTDGTEEGTSRVIDLRPGASGSSPRGLVSVGGQVAFAADDGVRGRELWVTDGHTTTCLSDPDAVPGTSVTGILGAARGTVFFAAPDGNGGSRGGVSDLTVEGTRVAVTFAGRVPVPFLTAVSGPDLFVWTLDQVDGQPGALVRVDRDATQTYLGKLVVEIADVRGRFFVAYQPLGSAGNELFALAADRGSLVRVLDRGDETSIAKPRGFSSVRGHLVFALTTVADGREPWVSDGTAAGTRLLADVQEGGEGSSPSAFLSLGTGLRCVFTATHAASGRELWTTDGTAEGTRLLCDLAAGEASSSPRPLTVAGDHLYFLATPDPLAYDAPRLYAIPLADLGIGRTLRDLDGDGYPDETESALGSDDDDPDSTPVGSMRLSDPSPLDVRDVRIRLRFDEAGRDTALVAGRVPVATAPTVEGTNVLVNAGGLVAQFTLDRHGRGLDEAGNRFRLQVHRRRGQIQADPAARFLLRFARGTHTPSLSDEGLTPVAADGDGAVDGASDSTVGLPALEVHLILGNASHAARRLLDFRLRRGASRGFARLRH